MNWHYMWYSMRKPLPFCLKYILETFPDTHPGIIVFLKDSTDRKDEASCVFCNHRRLLSLRHADGAWWYGVYAIPVPHDDI